MVGEMEKGDSAMSDRNMAPVWISRKLINTDDIYRWASGIGIKKMLPPEHLHLTLATVREPVDWSLVTLREDDLHLGPAKRPVQIFAWTIKALCVPDPLLDARHADLFAVYPQMDHPAFRPHISLFKGGRMPTATYDGPIALGPERIMEFNADNARGIKHMKVLDLLNEKK